MQYRICPYFDQFWECPTPFLDTIDFYLQQSEVHETCVALILVIKSTKCFGFRSQAEFMFKKPWRSKFGSMNLTLTTAYILVFLSEIPPFFIHNSDLFQSFKVGQKALAMPKNHFLTNWSPLQWCGSEPFFLDSDSTWPLIFGFGSGFGFGSEVTKFRNAA